MKYTTLLLTLLTTACTTTPTMCEINASTYQPLYSECLANLKSSAPSNVSFSDYRLAVATCHNNALDVAGVCK